MACKISLETIHRWHLPQYEDRFLAFGVSFTGWRDMNSFDDEAALLENS